MLDVQKVKVAQLFVLAFLLALQYLPLQVCHLGLVLLALFNASDYLSYSVEAALERLEDVVCQLLNL
jgi:hypothetical protein